MDNNIRGFFQHLINIDLDAPSSDESANPNPLPAPGQETLEAWQNVFQTRQLGELQNSFSASSPKEQQRMEDIFASIFTELSQTVQSLTTADTNPSNPLEAITHFSQNLFQNGFLQAFNRMAEGEDPLVQKIGSEVIQGSANMIPELLKSITQIDRTQITEMNAFTPLSTLIEEPLKVLKPLLSQGIQNTSSIYKKHLGGACITEDEADALIEECLADIQNESNVSIASIQGIKDPNTLEGRIQQIQQKNGSKNLEIQTRQLALVQDPQIQQTALQLIQGLPLTLIDNEGREELQQAVEQRLRMECTLAGCHSRQELEEKKEKVQELRAKLQENKNLLIELKRHYELLAGFAENETERHTLKHLFNHFEQDLDAYHLFQKAEQEIYIQLVQNIEHFAAEEFSSITQQGKNLDIEDFLQKMASGEILENSCNNMLASFLQLVKPLMDQTSDEIAKQGYLITTTLIFRIWQSTKRLQQATGSSSASALHFGEMLNINSGQILAKKREIILDEKDAQVYALQKLCEKNELDKLEWMGAMDGKDERTLMEELAQQEEAFYAQYLEIVHSAKEPNSPKIELIRDDDEQNMLELLQVDVRLD